MGSAIQYCILCQDQIPAKDITDGKAVQREGGLICQGCAKKAGIPAAAPPPSRPTPPPLPRRPPKGETSKILPAASHAHSARPLARPAHPPLPPARPAHSPLPMVYAGLGLLVLVLVFILATRDTSKPTPTEPPPVAHADPPRSNPAPTPPKADPREAEAQKAFDDVKAQADADEKDRQLAMAVSEWEQFPSALLEGKWAEKVANEKKRLRDAKSEIEQEAADACRRCLRLAAALADQQKYAEALGELDRFPDKYKHTPSAGEIGKARSRYEEAQRDLAKKSIDVVEAAQEQCFNAMKDGNHAAARKAWEALLSDPQRGAMARAQIDAIAAFEKDLQDLGVAEWVWKNHIWVQPKSGKVWDGQTEGNVLVHTNAVLDGTQVVLIGIDGKQRDAGWIACRGVEGQEVWNFETSAVHWNNAPKQMSVAAIEVADLLGDGKKEVLTVSNCVGMFPCRVCVLASDGKLKSEFWNPGQGGKPFVCELDGDGKPEVLLSFVNNDMNMTPTLACFRGCDISGEGPPKGKGSYLWYVQVPDAKLPLCEVSFERKKDKGPVDQILCKYQNGTWAVGPDGKVIKKQ